MKHPPIRPWLLAILTLGVAMLPVLLAWRSYREEARRRDAQLFEATSGLVVERLQLITVRHLNVINILRNQLRAQSASDSPRIPPNFHDSFPHLLALGYAIREDKQVILQWTDSGGRSPVTVGTNLAADSRLAQFLARSERSPVAITVPDPEGGDRLLVALPVGEAARVRGFIVGWLDIASLCRDVSVPQIQDGILAASPYREGSQIPNGAKAASIREGGAGYSVIIARGPKFDATYGPVAPWFVFTAGAGCAVLLAFLVFQTAKTARLRAALEAERMRGRMVQSFSHEFRTPLSVILSAADLLEAGADSLGEARRAEIISQIQDSTRRLSEMSEEILFLSRLESQQVELRTTSVELHAFCEALVRETAIATRNRCRIELSADGTATIDTALLRGALANLLSNAVKYSPAGSIVRFEARHDNGTLAFTVSDEGIGIPSDDLARAGEPFHRAANVGDIPGTGLGLAIAKRSASLLGGTLAIESGEGVGTTAQLTLPQT